MITLDNFKKLLILRGYKLANKTNEKYSKTFSSSDAVISVDFKEQKITYPNGLEVVRETTLNFSKNENFVEFECIDSLLNIGYKPSQIILEKGMPGGHDDTGGFCDIIVKDNHNKGRH